MSFLLSLLSIPKYYRFDLSRDIEESVRRKNEEAYHDLWIKILKKTSKELRGQWGESSLSGNNPAMEEVYREVVAKTDDIVVSSYKLKSRLLRELAKNGKIKVYKNDHRPDYHITVIDGYIFVKEYHPYGDDHNGVKRAVVGVNTLWGAADCLEEIERHFKVLKLVDPKEIDKEFPE